jgi:hypothetical protein
MVSPEPFARMAVFSCCSCGSNNKLRLWKYAPTPIIKDAVGLYLLYDNHYNLAFRGRELSNESHNKDQYLENLTAKVPPTL